MTHFHKNGQAAQSCMQSTAVCGKPYLVIGAGSLTATVWKKGNELAVGNYQFNIVRTVRRSGRVTQKFTTRNLRAFAKLIRTMALALADDGCLPPDDREDLCRLAVELRVVAANRSPHGRRNGSTEGKPC